MSEVYFLLYSSVEILRGLRGGRREGGGGREGERREGEGERRRGKREEGREREEEKRAKRKSEDGSICFFPAVSQSIYPYTNSLSQRPLGGCRFFMVL